MSEYRREKVLRVPLDKLSADPTDLSYELEYKLLQSPQGSMKVQSGYDYSAHLLHYYLDFVLEDDTDSEGSWSRSRSLYPDERAQFEQFFKNVVPEINMYDVRLVEFCWHDGSDPPAYYDEGVDPFYKSICKYSS